MSEMIHRVARAICTARGVNPDGRIRRSGTPVEPAWTAYVEDAVLVLQAMREPPPKVTTAVMIAAGKVAVIRDGEVYVRADAGEFIINAMIDEALK